ncbi:hypothetical protein IQ266_18475 [filamentous cyanobacterium LEGE 11480]|uniref:Uncharacterized protein n=1 Tax=Romeriopsis navalis LEGE 11480 TaxID=2777977 RepID=A0A928VQ63_9CYAN|nr:hypothetical protein [Romeriopsis navalis]MBE9031722.1 hypothetical protein [Romeriopsis navalis LEGE 11480]
MSSIITSGITIGVSSAFAIVHLYSKQLHRSLFKSAQIALSFSGGLAIAYVFLHLLPELEKGETVLGHAPSHLISLSGFIFFYGCQRLAWNSAQKWDFKYHQAIFWIQMLFACLYNFLLIYTIPQSLESSIIWAIVYVIALGLHLLASNHAYQEKYGQLFDRYGRFLLVGSLVFGVSIKLGIQFENEYFTDGLMALLAGFLMFNIFSEELPDHRETHYGWFVLGTALYVGLISSSFYLVGPETEGTQAIINWLHHS